MICEKYLHLQADGGQAVLATVVDAKGSSYRLPGARMLIDESGRSIGTVSGGCLEADVLEHAKKVLQTGRPTVITYDTTQNDDSVFGLGMGCRGVIRVLLEPAQNNQSLEFLRNCIEQRIIGAMAILIDAPEDFPNAVGTKIFARSNGNGKPTLEANNFLADGLLPRVSVDLRGALTEQSSRARIYETDNGVFEFFLETVAPPVSLLLFGAGYDALPLVGFAGNLGWRVSVVDHRAGWATAERFPEADQVIVSRVGDLPETLFGDKNSVAVLMTHNYEHDREILPRLLNSSVRYIGVLGPKKRTERLLADIGGNFSESQLAKLYAPVGLDIGAEAPEQIALAITAEIQGVLENRPGGFLRERSGGIH